MPDKMTAPKVLAMKGAGKRIVCVTAYDAPTGRIADAAGVDLILVGDSVGNVVLGYETTLPVTIEEMVHHTRAVRRGVRRALLVADMPFGCYQASVSDAVDAAVSLVKAGAEAVKLEGAYLDAIRAIIKAGIPVMGHVGMTPQSVNAFGGFRVQGKGDEASRIRDDACEISEAGVFSIVLELMPMLVAKAITEIVAVPTIGIGAGPYCDGQIQVFHDLVGLSEESFKHVKKFANGREDFEKAVASYAEEVRDNAFPKEENSF